MIKKALHKTGYLWALALACMGASCSGDSLSDDPELMEDEPVEVAFTLSSRYNGMTTRDDGSPADPVNDNEKIKDWFLVFADKTNTVRKVLKRSDAEALIAAPASAVEEETFRCILPSGTYSVYAFANITPETLAAATSNGAAAGVTFKEGEKLPDGVENAVWNAAGVAKDLNLWNIDTDAMPMTGFLKGIKVINTIEERFSIEVVRMGAKIELRFINPGKENVDVTKIDFSPVTTSGVSLFPRSDGGLSYAHLGQRSYSALSGATYDHLSFTPAGGITVSPTPDNTASADLVKSVFYTKESISKDNDNDGPFSVTLDLKYADNTTQTLQFKPTQKIKGYINRNDWIVIPVKLSRYVVTTTGLFYPPIGGYPSMIQTGDDEGRDIYTLGTQGEFSIFVDLVDQLSENKMPSGRYTLSMTSEAGSDDIFEKKPTLNFIPGTNPVWEIFGEAGTNVGNAELTLTVNLYDNETHTDTEIPKQVYTHKIRIVRQN